MKFLILSLALLAAPAYATCVPEAEFARTVMKARQMNVDMVLVMQRTSNEKKIVDIIVDAYSVPLMSMQKYKDQEVVEFANKVLVQCLKAKG